MPPSLGSLPVELIEHIICYLPNKDSLLQLRLVNRELAAKCSRCFCKAYFACSSWTLTDRTINILTSIVKIDGFALHMTSLRLVGPSHHRQAYANFLLDEDSNAEKCHKTLSSMACLKTLKLKRFGLINAPCFLRNLLHNLSFPYLETLRLNDVSMDAAILAAFIKENRNTLKQLKFFELDLKGVEEECGHSMPWSSVLLAIVTIKHECNLDIREPLELEETALMVPPEIEAKIETGEIELYSYKALRVEEVGCPGPMKRSLDCDGLCECVHYGYGIYGSDEWRESVDMLRRYYERRIHQCNGELDPPISV